MEEKISEKEKTIYTTGRIHKLCSTWYDNYNKEKKNVVVHSERKNMKANKRIYNMNKPYYQLLPAYDCGMWFGFMCFNNTFEHLFVNSNVIFYWSHI